MARILDKADEIAWSHAPHAVGAAGHDACWINKVAPKAMIMCPCVDGLSHNEAETIFKEWAQAGADVLLHAVMENDRIVARGSSAEMEPA